MPYKLLEKWLSEEKDNGAPNPLQAVLSTVSSDSIPHARVVAIREISSEGFIFFTQKLTRKVSEIKNNPNVVMTFWFELLQRQAIIEGKVEALTDLENENYWRTYPREAQIRFSAYAPTSSQAISSKQILEDKRASIASEYNKKDLPMSPHYCGFCFKPNRFVFYAYLTTELSDVNEYCLRDNSWFKQILSP